MRVIIKRIAIAECLPKRFEYDVPEGINVRDLIVRLSNDFDQSLYSELLDHEEIAEGSLIMLNGLSLFQPDVSLDTELHDGDTILFAVMVYGG